jgi:DNA polymerase III alpha subunit (gram-positive type)
MTSRSKITIIYDLETTGFCPMPMFSNYHKVVQICASCIETGDIFNEFVNPGFEAGIPIPSTKIHNISSADVCDALPIDIVLENMYRFFSFEKYDVVEMIAHNNTYFDKLMLMKEYKTVKNDKYLPDNIIFWDSLPFLRQNYTSLTSYSLGDLFKSFYKSELANAHRADADVRALQAIYLDFILPLKNDDDDVMTENDIIKKRVNDDCITNIRFIGPWRANLCYKYEKIETVSQLTLFAQKLNGNGNLKAFDSWLRDTLNIFNTTQRYFIVSTILDIPIWDDYMTKFINTIDIEDCIDAVDYYIKYRYALNKKPPNYCIYNRGLMNLFHRIS